MNIQVSTAAPTPDKVPLCDLQRTAKQGEQRSVQVGGIYITGFEGSVLTDAACPDQSTWVELDLKSTANKEQLRSMLDTAGKADVVFEGEFYGPGMPSPNLPEAIRKSYQPGWGHLGAFKTKLVVHAIQSVKPVPADHPASADLSQRFRSFRNPRCRSILPSGGPHGYRQGGCADDSQRRPGDEYRSEIRSPSFGKAAQGQLKTWRFASDVNGTFTVTYTYAISGERNRQPDESQVEMLPSLDVNITARRSSPSSCMACRVIHRQIRPLMKLCTLREPSNPRSCPQAAQRLVGASVGLSWCLWAYLSKSPRCSASELGGHVTPKRLL